jgi:hypothetical protein
MIAQYAIFEPNACLKLDNDWIIMLTIHAFFSQVKIIFNAPIGSAPDVSRSS